MLLRNLYDSHSHIVSTGQLARQWNLGKISAHAELSPDQAPAFRRGPWLLGFGWDENRLAERRPWTRSELDRLFPQDPIYLSRCDGHAGLINSAGLAWLGAEGLKEGDLTAIPGGTFGGETSGRDSGLATENTHFRILQAIPAPDSAEIKEAIREACRKFNEQGYTHVRDMEGCTAFFEAALALEAEGQQTLQIDWNFVCENPASVETVLSELAKMRSRQTSLNRVVGFKFYMDGSLGSRTALLSRPYADDPGAGQGVACWEAPAVESLFERVWRAGFPIACHTIGDAAADFVVETARRVSAGGTAGHLHLEHVEVLRDETIQKMKPLHVRCHLQPCHFLSDRRWLRERLGPLYASAFPWEALRRARIPLSFGHDSPIEAPVIEDNLRALEMAAREGIPRFADDPWRYMVHPDPGAASGETVIEDGRILETRLEGKIVFKAR